MSAARIASLERIRKTKEETAQRIFTQAADAFRASHQRCETMIRQRDDFARMSLETTQRELAHAMTNRVDVTDISAIHDADIRRHATLVHLTGEIKLALEEREKLRLDALDKQKAFLQARKSVKKIGLLREELRREENSLQDRMAESLSDSALRDAVSGKWTLLQADS